MDNAELAMFGWMLADANPNFVDEKPQRQLNETSIEVIKAVFGKESSNREALESQIVTENRKDFQTRNVTRKLEELATEQFQIVSAILPAPVQLVARATLKRDKAQSEVVLADTAHLEQVRNNDEYDRRQMEIAVAAEAAAATAAAAAAVPAAAAAAAVPAAAVPAAAVPAAAAAVPAAAAPAAAAPAAAAAAAAAAASAAEAVGAASGAAETVGATASGAAPAAAAATAAAAAAAFILR